MQDAANSVESQESNRDVVSPEIPVEKSDVLPETNVDEEQSSKPKKDHKIKLILDKTYVKAVNDVSFKVKRGETLGIVGESGCGKSTMGRSILRLFDITDGKVFFEGTEITALKPRELRKFRTKMQIIFQDPYGSLPPRSPVGQIIGEAVKVHKIVPKSEYRDYVIDIMRKCGLQDFYFDRYPHEFSGGQRQRICIARALAVKPKFVVCDEPVSALDVSIQAQVINLLKELQRDLGLTYLFISHDLSVVQHISDRVGVMYLGQFVEMGDEKDIFNNPMHPYTHALLSAVPVPDPHYKGKRIVLQGDIPSPANPPSGCKFHTRCSRCMEVCKHVQPKFKDYGNGHMCACHLYPQD
ncbi:MAG: ATP-binding cassette domain-containing protein [Clostridiales bacterium]|nr:ATP-binding cassette domain-containing protein [Clostridiales bacterium]